MAATQTATFEIRALDRTKAVLDKVDRRLARTSRKAAALGKKFSLALTAPIAAVGIAATRMGADFEKAMNEVNSLLGLPREQFMVLRKEVRDLSVEMGVDLPTSARALYQAISAGIPRENALDFLKVASKSAIAGVAQVDEAVTLLTKTMDGYGSKSVDVRTLSDQLFATVKGGVTNFSELAQALPNVAGIAANLNVESKELLGVLARTTKVSESTSGAVTRIASAMTALIKPSKDMESLLAKAEIKNVALEIKANGLTNTLLKLRAAAKGNETVIAKAFGRKEAILLLQDLAGNTEAWRKQIDAVSNSAGAMQQAFELNDKGISRAMERVKASFQGVADQIAIVLAPHVEKLGKFMGVLSRKISETDPRLVKLALVIAAVAAAIGPVLVAFALLTKSLAVVAGFFAGGGLLAAVGIITGIVIATGAAKAVMDNYNGSISGATGKLTSMGDVAAQVMQFLKNSVDLVSIGITALGVGVLKWVEYFGRVMEAIHTMPRVWELAMTTIRASVETGFNATMQALENVANNLLTLISSTVTKAVNAILEKATEGVNKLINGFLKIPGVGKLLGIDGPINIGVTVDAPKFDKIDLPEFNSGIVPTLPPRSGAEDYWRSFADGMAQEADAAGARVVEAWNAGANDDILRGWEKMKKQGGAAMQEMEEKAGPTLEKIIKLLEEAAQAAAGGGKGGKGGLAGAAQAAASEFQELQSIADQSLSVMQERTDSVFNNLGSALDQFVDTGKVSFSDLASSIIRDLIKMELRAQASMLFRGALGGIFGGFGGLFGGFGGLFGGGLSQSLVSYSGGGYTGSGARAGGVDGRGGFPAILHPNETVVDHSQGQAAAGNVTIQQTVYVTETVPEGMARQIAEAGKNAALTALREIKARGGKRAQAYA